MSVKPAPKKKQTWIFQGIVFESVKQLLFHYWDGLVPSPSDGITPFPSTWEAKLAGIDVGHGTYHGRMADYCKVVRWHKEVGYYVIRRPKNEAPTRVFIAVPNPAFIELSFNLNSWELLEKQRELLAKAENPIKETQMLTPDAPNFKKFNKTELTDMSLTKLRYLALQYGAPQPDVRPKRELVDFVLDRQGNVSREEAIKRTLEYKQDDDPVVKESGFYIVFLDTSDDDDNASHRTLALERGRISLPEINSLVVACSPKDAIEKCGILIEGRARLVAATVSTFTAHVVSEITTPRPFEVGREEEYK